MVDLITDTQNTGDEISCPMYDVPTEGSHPFIHYFPCNSDNKLISDALPTSRHTLISTHMANYATSPSTSPATSPATSLATS